MKKLALLMLLVVGCENDPVEFRSTDNPQVPVALLFEHDGCKVYRFSDAGYKRYFAKCESSASVSGVVNCGKNCTRVEEVPTVTVKP